MSKKIGIGIIGLGWAGRESLKCMCKDDRVAPAAVCDVNRKLGESVAKEHGVARVYERPRDLLADRNVRAVTVALPNSMHAPVAIAALEAGKHVICEKPPALNAKEARKAADAAKRNRRILMYALCMRYGPEAQYVRRLTDSGELGEVYYARCGYVRRSGIPIGAGGWFVDKARSGGGALIDIGVHILDVTWFMMGSPRPVAASGAAFRKFPQCVPKNIKYNVDDSSFGFIKFETGAVLYVEATWALNMPEGNVSCIAGTKAGVRLDPLTIYKDINGAPVEISPHPRGVDGFTGESRHFIDCITQKKTPISSAEQGVQLMQMLDGIYESARTGREVRIGRHS